MEVQLPRNETRPHEVVVLDNELQVVVVSDEKAEMASAAMEVEVGSFTDPVCVCLILLLPDRSDSFAIASRRRSKAWLTSSSTCCFSERKSIQWRTATIPFCRRMEGDRTRTRHLKQRTTTSKSSRTSWKKPSIALRSSSSLHCSLSPQQDAKWRPLSRSTRRTYK